MIRDPSDVKTYIVAHGLGNLACLVHLYISARNKFGLRISKLNLEKFKTFSRETYALFTGNFLGKIYQNSTRLAFSTFLPANQLTSFDVADKITNIVAIPVNVVIESQLHKAGAGKISSRSNMAQLSMIAIALLSISATAILFSRLLVTALYSHDVNNTANILKILILATSVGIVNSYIRTFVYLNNNETSKSNSLLAVASSTNIAAILLAGQLNLYTSITGPLIFFGTEILVLGLLVRNSNYSTKKREKNDNT
jgi:O-antigen/teichoic acid export membrane protein